MKYLCFAYGAEKDWRALTKGEQEGLLAQDEVMRNRGALMAAVETNVVTVRAWSGAVEISESSFAELQTPLAGFCIIEAADLNEVIELVAKTPAPAHEG